MVIFSMGDAISEEVQWAEDEERCLELSPSLASIQLHSMGERGAGDEQLLLHINATEWAPRQ